MEQKQHAGKQLAAIRIRGFSGVKQKVESTLTMLRLYRKNYCVVVPNNPIYEGMLKQAKDYITWGEIDEETLHNLLDKRAEESDGNESDSNEKIKYNDFIVVNGKKIKKYFRLNSPKKGYGKKGIKHTFKEGGALGYRGNDINNLIKRMV